VSIRILRLNAPAHCIALHLQRAATKHGSVLLLVLLLLQRVDDWWRKQTLQGQMV
jgi:hypothetical protein